MTTNAGIGFGALLAIFNDGSPSGFQTIAEVTSISGPSLARDAVDATHTASEEGWREYIPGLKDAGEVSIEMNYIPGSFGDELMRATFDSDQPAQFRITEPNSPATVLTFYAIVTAYELERPNDDKMVATATLKITGKVTYNGS